MLFLLNLISLTFAATNPFLSSWIMSTGPKIFYNGSNVITDVTSISYSSTNAYIQAQGIPSNNLGPWTQNPNTPSGQNFTFSFPLTPTILRCRHLFY